MVIDIVFSLRVLDKFKGPRYHQSLFFCVFRNIRQETTTASILITILIGRHLIGLYFNNHALFEDMRYCKLNYILLSFYDIAFSNLILAPSL